MILDLAEVILDDTWIVENDELDYSLREVSSLYIVLSGLVLVLSTNWDYRFFWNGLSKEEELLLNF
jgi:hypothetical protein